MLDSININYYVTDGTYLVSIEMDALLHDHDLDIALIDCKKILRLTAYLLRDGWRLGRLVVHNFHIYQIVF